MNPAVVRWLFSCVMVSFALSLSADVIYDMDGPSGVSGGGTSLWAVELTLASPDPIDFITTGLSDSVAGPVTMTCYIFDGDGDASTTPGALLGSASVTADFPSTTTEILFDFSDLAVPSDGHIVVAFDTSSPMGRSQESEFTTSPVVPDAEVGTYIADWTASTPAGTDWSDFFGAGFHVPVTFAVVTAVPEPSSMALLGIGAGVALWRRRRTPAQDAAAA